MRVRGGREDDERLRGERGSKTPEFKRRVLRGVIAEDRLNERGKSALHARFKRERINGALHLLVKPCVVKYLTEKPREI